MVPKSFLVDLDGTTYLGERLIDGAKEFFQWLHETGRPFRFLTNNSSHPADYYVKKLRRLGIPCPQDAVFTSTKATIRFLQKSEIHSVYTLGTPDFDVELREAGVTVEEHSDCVVVAFDTTLTYQKANHAFQLLQRGAQFIATHPDILCPVEEGFVLDCGSILAMLERATSRKPIIIGKPNPEMIRLALDEISSRPEEALVIGDRLYTDMKMGKEAGAKTALVLTGETRLEDKISIQVDYVAKNIGELRGLLDQS